MLSKFITHLSEHVNLCILITTCLLSLLSSYLKDLVVVCLSATWSISWSVLVPFKFLASCKIESISDFPPSKRTASVYAVKDEFEKVWMLYIAPGQVVETSKWVAICEDNLSGLKKLNSWAQSLPHSVYRQPNKNSSKSWHKIKRRLWSIQPCTTEWTSTFVLEDVVYILDSNYETLLEVNQSKATLVLSMSKFNWSNQENFTAC